MDVTQVLNFGKDNLVEIANFYTFVRKRFYHEILFVEEKYETWEAWSMQRKNK